MRISIVGTGYVGLVTGACLADRGHDVTCIDVDRSKVDAINAGQSPIHEQGLPEMLASTVGTHLRATTDLRTAVLSSELTFIAVGTPAVEGRIDLSFVCAAAREIGAALRDKHEYHVVVVKSTVIPGTTDGVVRRALEESSGKAAGRDFGLGMNPEFLTEGSAIEDFSRPDRIVIGGLDARTQKVVGQVYASFQDAPRIDTNNTTAEFIKYASNAVLATMISFSNEISRLCTAVGDVDVVDVMNGVHEALYFTTRLAGRDPVKAAITSFLEAGCGFGGSCLPKDVTALLGQGRDYGLDMRLLNSVLEVNRGQPAEVLKLIERHRPDLEGARVTVLGIAFKPDTDDTRESPAFPVIERLIALGAQVTVYDPVVRPVDDARLSGVCLAASLPEAVADADIVVIVTRWKEFENLPQALREAGSSAWLVDGRRMIAPDAWANYSGIGRARDGAFSGT